MNYANIKKNLLRLYKLYVKKHFPKLILALILSFAVAGGTAAIAWLLDPAIKKIFIERDNTMMLYIPIAIVLAFSIKGLSLYFARSILIRIGNEVVKALQIELSSCILKSDVNTIESKHSGKYIAHVFYDTSQVSQLVSCFNVLSKLEACIICFDHDAASSICGKIIRKKNWKSCLGKCKN